MEVQTFGSVEAEAFSEEIRSKVTRIKNRGSDVNPCENAVVNALDCYTRCSPIDPTAHQEAFIFATRPLRDFIALSRRTEAESALRELALSMLKILTGEEAVDAAFRTLNGSGVGLL